MSLIIDAFHSGLYLVLQYLFGGKKQALALMMDYLKGYLKDREKMEEKPVCIFSLIVIAQYEGLGREL
jgi:hypothetical protein